MRNLIDFLKESNAIEGIVRPPTAGEIDLTVRFLTLASLSVGEVSSLVEEYCRGTAYGYPNAALRARHGMDVKVGNYVAPSGGPWIPKKLDMLLRGVNEKALSPWLAHCRYEAIHPYMDANGRSGRAIWAWMMGKQGKRVQLTFLHHFYYQTLKENRYARAKVD